MKKIAAVATLLVCLSTPLFAAPTDDDSPSRANPISRVVHLVKHFFATLLEGGDVTWPRP
jgi:hypothetical protein